MKKSNTEHGMFNRLANMSRRRKMLVGLATILLFTCITIITLMPTTKQQTDLHNHYFYITALFWNNEDILPNWTHQILKVIDNHMDPNKVFVSIVENDDSTDDTKDMLLEFKQKLENRGIKNNFEFKKRSVRGDRIKHLAILRNVALESLPKTNFPMDRTSIVFLNDIYFQASDVITLIETNRMQYDAACALDYNAPNFYDIWVSRDLRGYEMYLHYPYFMDKVARQQVRENKPVRVFCCWNGVIVMKATPFLPPHNIVFRERNKETDKYLSECSFLCKDFWFKDFTHWLINPAVRVTYSWRNYYLVNYIFPYTWDIFSDWFTETLWGPISSPNYDSKDLSLLKLIPDSASKFKEDTYPYPNTR